MTDNYLFSPIASTDGLRKIKLIREKMRITKHIFRITLALIVASVCMSASTQKKLVIRKVDFDQIKKETLDPHSRYYYPRLLKKDHECETAKKAMDVVEFLHDVLKVQGPLGTFPHKVSLHNSCHGVRELGLSSPSEMHVSRFNKIRDLLELVEGIDVVEPERPDECCGFGGMFSVEETAISAQMGRDKVERHMATGAEYITGPDCSCLMHMAGVAKKQGMNIQFKHVVEILAAGL